MSLSNHSRTRVTEVWLWLEDGSTERFELGPENAAFVHKYVNHRCVGAGLSKYVGGEFLEYSLHWVAPTPDRLPVQEAPPAEVVSDGETYIPVVD